MKYKRDFRFISFCVLPLYLLSSCTMIPSYETPNARIQPSWPDVGIHKFKSEGVQVERSAAETPWQDYFIDPTLQSLIGSALNNNHNLQVAQLNVDATRAIYRIERANLFPHFNITGESARQKTPQNASITGRDQINESYSVQLASTSYELDIWGRVRSLNEKALETYFATEEVRDAVRIALIAEVANAYLNLLADRSLLHLTNETLDSQTKAYDLIKGRVERGIGSEQDLAQARILVETARRNQSIYMRRIAQDENALSLLLGQDVRPFIYEDSKLDHNLMVSDLPVGLSSHVLLSRPDIKAAEHQLKAANADIGAARAAFFPMISLIGSGGFASSDLDNLFSSGSQYAWSFVPRITLPIFMAGQNMANLDLAEIRKKIEIAEYEEAVQRAFMEASNELAARFTLESELMAQKNLVAASQKNYDISQARYMHGIDSHLTVLDAQRELYAAQQNEVSLLLSQYMNYVMLYKVLGGGRL
jgi:multidrug efflux system outer membrane protein